MLYFNTNLGATLNSSPRFERWFPKAIRQPPTLRACSGSIPLQSRGYWRETVQRLRTPNSVQSSTTNNLQSDTLSRRLSTGFTAFEAAMFPGTHQGWTGGFP